MKLQLKSTLIIVGTLLIGMILGALVLGMVQRSFHPDSDRGPRKDRFNRMMTHLIKPTPDQEPAVDKILDSYAPRFTEQYQRHAAEMRNLFDSLNQELEPVLTPEQMASLKERMERFRSGFGRKGPRRHPDEPPPPPDEGP